MSDEFPSEIKKKKRTLSRFLCRELLYDYADGRLDEERRHAVEEFLEGDEDTRRELEDIRSAIQYSEDLGQTVVTEHLMAQLKDQRNMVKQTKERVSWRNWPTLVRWSVEALGVAAIIAMVVVLLPRGHWRDWWPEKIQEVVLLERNETKLAALQGNSTDEKSGLSEVSQEPVKAPADVVTPKEATSKPKVAAKVIQSKPEPKPVAKSQTKAPSADESKPTKTAQVQPKDSSKTTAEGARKVVEQIALPEAKAPAELKKGDSQVHDGAETKTAEIRVKKETSKQPDQKSDTTAKAAASSQSGEDSDAQEALAEDGETIVEAKADTNKNQPKGFVYRAFMDHTQLDEITPQIADGIRHLGGSKAGKVKLGWRKPKGSYFHFSLDEAQYDAVMKLLRTFGPVRISKDPHRRVMPDGKIRFILWIEDISVQ